MEKTTSCQFHQLQIGDEFQFNGWLMKKIEDCKVGSEPKNAVYLTGNEARNGRLTRILQGTSVDKKPSVIEFSFRPPSNVLVHSQAQES